MFVCKQKGKLEEDDDQLEDDSYKRKKELDKEKLISNAIATNSGNLINNRNTNKSDNEDQFIISSANIKTDESKANKCDTTKEPLLDNQKQESSPAQSSRTSVVLDIGAAAPGAPTGLSDSPSGLKRDKQQPANENDKHQATVNIPELNVGLNSSDNNENLINLNEHDEQSATQQQNRQKLEVESVNITSSYSSSSSSSSSCSCSGSAKSAATQASTTVVNPVTTIDHRLSITSTASSTTLPTNALDAQAQIASAAAIKSNLNSINTINNRYKHFEKAKRNSINESTTTTTTTSSSAMTTTPKQTTPQPVNEFCQRINRLRFIDDSASSTALTSPAESLNHLHICNGSMNGSVSSLTKKQLQHKYLNSSNYMHHVNTSTSSSRTVSLPASSACSQSGSASSTPAIKAKRHFANGIKRQSNVKSSTDTICSDKEVSSQHHSSDSTGKFIKNKFQNHLSKLQYYTSQINKPNFV